MWNFWLFLYDNIIVEAKNIKMDLKDCINKKNTSNSPLHQHNYPIIKLQRLIFNEYAVITREKYVFMWKYPIYSYFDRKILKHTEAPRNLKRKTDGSIWTTISINCVQFTMITCKFSDSLQSGWYLQQ